MYEDLCLGAGYPTTLYMLSPHHDSFADEPPAKILVHILSIYQPWWYCNNSKLGVYVTGGEKDSNEKDFFTQACPGHCDNTGFGQPPPSPFPPV